MLGTPSKKQQEYPLIRVEQLQETQSKKILKFPQMNSRGLDDSSHSKTTIFTIKHVQSQPSLSQKLPNHPFLPSTQKSRGFSRNDTSHSINEEKRNTSQKKNPIVILTAAQTLQNQYIANKIDIDLGSLNEFLDDDIKITQSKVKFKKLGKSPYSNKYDASNSKKSVSIVEGDDQDKVNRNQDDQDEEKEYDLKKSKYINPVDALKNEDDEKRRQLAAKVIIQQIFKQNYGDDIDKFEEQSALELYKLRNQDDLLDQDSQLTKFLKKNARRSLKEKLNILSDQLEEQNVINYPNMFLGNQQSNQVNNPSQAQGQKFPSKQVKINEALTDKKRKLVKDDDVNYFDNQDTSRNDDNDGKGINKLNINSQQNLNMSRNDSQFNKIQHGKTKYLNNSQLNSQSDNDIPIYLQQQTPQALRNVFSISKHHFEFRFNYIMDMKFRNQDITQLWTSYGCENESARSQNDKLYKDYFETQIKFYQMYFKRNKNYEHYKERKRKVQFTESDYEEVQKEYQEYPKEEVLLIDQNQITVWNQKLESTFMMFLTLNYSHLHSLQKVELFKTQLKEDGILILLEAITKECQNLKFLTLSYNKIGQRAMLQINKIISQFQLSVLGLRNVEMNTKQFCHLCIAMAETQTITDLDVSENQLDERSIEGIRTIIRYIKNLVKLNVSKNNIPEQRLKELKKQMYDSIKNKEITFF